MEAIKTNIGSTLSLVELAEKYTVNKCILVSTDKAVNPVNLYGATKLVSDKLFVNANNLAGEKKTRFALSKKSLEIMRTK